MTSSLSLAIFWGAAALCAVAQIAILYSVFVGAPAARAAGKATATVVDHRRLETMWALLPAAGLILTLALTWRAVESPNGASWRLVLPDAREEPAVMLPALPVTPSAAPGAPARAPSPSFPMPGGAR